MRTLFFPLVLFLLFCCSYTAVHAQENNIVDQLGGVTLDMKVSSPQDTSWKVYHAALVKRAVRKEFSGPEVLHLELAVNQPIREVMTLGTANQKFLELGFVNEQDEVIYTFRTSFSKMKRWPKKSSLAKYVLYRLEMRGVPHIIFDLADRIDITYVFSTKRY